MENGSSREVFHAKIFHSLAKALGWGVAAAACGFTTRDSLASYDRDTRSWRTWGLSLFGGLMEYSGAFPKLGMMRSGAIYGPLKLERRISGRESGLCPTPTAASFKGGRLSPRIVKGREKEKNNYQDFCSLVLRMRYPHPEFGEQIMGYPKGWTDEGISTSEMRLSLKSRK